MKKFFILLLTVPLFLFSDPKIVIKHPWVKEPPPGPNTTMVGMIIRNEGDEEDLLIGAKSNIAERVEIHKTVFDNGVAKMVRKREIPIPPQGEVEFRHHGYHIMLIGLKRKLKEGDRIKITLIFKKSGEITIEAPVIKKHMMHHHHKM